MGFKRKPFKGKKGIHKVNKSKPIIKCIKFSLHKFVKDENTRFIIEETVLKGHKIVIHTLQFMKLYMIYCFDEDIPFPKINRNFVTSIIKVICRPRTTTGDPNGKKLGGPFSEQTRNNINTLTNFYNVHYKPFMLEELEYDHMSSIIDYLSDDIVIMYANNIKQHYIEYIERYVNVSFNKKQVIEDIRSLKIATEEKNTRVNHFCTELRKIKNDLLSCEKKYTSDAKYHTWIIEYKKRLIPSRKLIKDNLYYDLQCNPYDYLGKMIYMMKYVESTGNTIYNVCPLRTNIVPKYIPIDTVAVVRLMMTENKKFYRQEGNLVKYQRYIWRKFFHIDKYKKKDYVFRNIIRTDGVACSMLMVRKDLMNKRLPKEPKISTPEEYIDELKDYSALKDMRVVSVDPGMSDLLHSCRCYAYEGKCEYTKKCDNPKPLKKGETYPREQVWRHGLLLCQQCKV
mmetsp:Transcript_1262/g.1863  ORF Transcript_1262/g.1863 Transcript_1262/m.1863 type:complete len:454 (+) Transcript_1262:513-1874(+)